MDTNIIRRIKAQLAVATATLEDIHNSPNRKDMSVLISLRDLIALVGVSDTAFKFLQENKTILEHQARLEMVDRTLEIVGGILVDHYSDKVFSTTQKILDPASVADAVRKGQSH